MRQLLSYDGYYPSSAGFFDWFCRYGCNNTTVVFPDYERPMFGNGYPLVPGNLGSINSYSSVVDPTLTVGTDSETSLESLMALFNTKDIIGSTEDIRVPFYEEEEDLRMVIPDVDPADTVETYRVNPLKNYLSTYTNNEPHFI